MRRDQLQSYAVGNRNAVTSETVVWEINIDGAWVPMHSETQLERRYQTYLRRKGSAYYETPRAAVSFASMIISTTIWDACNENVINVTYLMRRNAPCQNN